VTVVTITSAPRWHPAQVSAISPAAVAGAPSGDPQTVQIELLPHDPAWVRRFCRERDRIACALGARARRIEHVGSTAVPALAARPIVDVMLVVDDAEDEPGWLPALERIGHRVRVRKPGHRILRPADAGVHLHVLSAGSPEERRRLLFRDRLRRSARLRREYEALKRDLAARPWPSVERYADAKGPFIERALGSRRRA